ncbi:MAG: N-acetylmuramoyl-L-alanine amidase [Eubacteriales bacterium]|nr:N-acetylmuramoyl-L-alanine amidase [Eubacteriales bacterium]
MATIYLSPSTQEYNKFVTGNSEEYYANLIADAMAPYLRASDISFTRNNPGGTVVNSIADSNAGNYDFHLAIHSNAAPDRLKGMLQGPDVYYFQDSVQGKRAAEIFANNLKEIYPNPSLVSAIPTTSLAELRRTQAPAILVEVAYHDNIDDANWIINNIEAIAANLALSTADFLGVPFVEPNA